MLFRDSFQPNFSNQAGWKLKNNNDLRWWHSLPGNRSFNV
jgi:hypothetical protein